MSLAKLDRDERIEKSMIELAVYVLEEEKKAMNYKDIYDRIAELKEYTEEQKADFFAQFYTDLNLDGRFLTLGKGQWGLKTWYPVEQIDEEITAEPKKKKKKKAAPKKKKKKKEEPVAAEEEEDLTEVPLEALEADFKNDEEDAAIDLGDEEDIEEDELDDVFDDSFDEEDEEEDDEEEKK
ncbi:DNA-directed RNA polymerase subunit delta [Pelagirhabdus alkalitolerans]|uniref:Probable DNA-directed RNA polymerase subunit delta n=1 Tax=Pelagirhabdus alkalitolerans TaxID=1612202 RepID=A0A1G6GI11_9BACI|nr:DNA-directed RNA polymerase subunit delta [Pelagirhabdus alkalitolerans]SDB81584.1 DNA-directed RNA polymerase subunit delta [Pelagirhabdus alkalitolerans]